MPSLISVAEFRNAVKDGAKPSDGVFHLSTQRSVAVEGAPRTRRFCFSDGSIDRMGDTIAPDGWDTADFEANPVALWAHDSSQPPIGRATNVAVEGKRLMGDIEFIPPETYSFAETIYQMVVGGFLRAVSVGFLPIKYSFVENDPDRGWGIDFEKQTLLEISVCPVPANPNALAEARAKGIDTRPLIGWAEKLLDNGGRVILPRTELERLRKAAKEPTMTRRPVRRADDDEPDDDKNKASCGNDADEKCGFDDPSECSVHRSAKADDDAEKALLRALHKLLALKRREADDEDRDSDRDEPPIAHEDAIRMAHKCMRTAKAFQAEAMNHYGKAMDHLDGVVDALDSADPESDAPTDDDPDAEKAARILRAAERKRRTGV